MDLGLSDCPTTARVTAREAARVKIQNHSVKCGASRVPGSTGVGVGYASGHRQLVLLRAHDRKKSDLLEIKGLPIVLNRMDDE